MRCLQAACCTLLPLQAVHAGEMFVVLSDPALYAVEGEPPPSVDWLAQRYARLESRASPDGGQQWLNWVVQLPCTVARPPGGVLAGAVQATVLPSGMAWVAYELASRHWRRGIGSAAVAAMLAELVSGYGVHTALAVLKARNAASQALLCKLGFVPGWPLAAAAAAQEAVEDDEIVMHRRLVQADRADSPPTGTSQAAARQHGG